MAKLKGKKEQYYFLPGGSQCAGCASLLTAKLALKEIFDTRRETIVMGSTCGSGMSPLIPSGLGLRDSTAAALTAALEIRGINKAVVSFSGEGQLLDMGFDDLSGAFERGFKYMQVCFDNEAYASSGGHRTGTTSLGAKTKIHLQGKPTRAKIPALMLIFNGAAYTATASPAYVDDFREKIRKGMQYMPSFIHITTPCITSWGFDPEYSVLLARLMVETGAFPLYEYCEGVFRRTVRVENQKPLEELLGYQRRFRGIDKDQDTLNLLKKSNEDFNRIIDRLEIAFQDGSAGGNGNPLPG
jgi:pyruvate ferredoxin oxidoreductase beta subunit